MMRGMKTTGCAAIALTAAVLLGATPAAAEAGGDEDESVFVDDSYNGFRQVTGEGDDAYWTISIRSAGAYVATWERDKGLWKSPAQAVATINEAALCRGEIYESVFDTISGFDEFVALPIVETTTNEDGSSSMAFTSESAEGKAIKACSEGRSWNWDGIESVATDDPDLHTTRIPLSLIGPGMHRLFVVPVQYVERVEHDFADGSSMNYSGGIEKTGEAQQVTVAIPQGRSSEFPFTAVVDSGSLTDPGRLASAPAALFAGSDQIMTAAPAALMAAVFTALIGLPLALFRRTRQMAEASAGESNE